MQGLGEIQGSTFTGSSWRDNINSRANTVSLTTIQEPVQTTLVLDAITDLAVTSGMGGGVSLQTSLAAGAQVTFQKCTFEGNIADAGAGVFMIGRAFEVEGESGVHIEFAAETVLSNNVAGALNSGGGAVYVGGVIGTASSLLLQDSTMHSNRAAWGGAVAIATSVFGSVEVSCLGPCSLLRN